MSWAIQEKNYSQRRACALVGLAPKVYRHRHRRGDDSVLRERLRALAIERRRFGYRRLQLLLRHRQQIRQPYPRNPVCNDRQRGLAVHHAFDVAHAREIRVSKVCEAADPLPQEELERGGGGDPGGREGCADP